MMEGRCVNIVSHSRMEMEATDSPTLRLLSSVVPKCSLVPKYPLVLVRKRCDKSYDATMELAFRWRRSKAQDRSCAT